MTDQSKDDLNEVRQQQQSAADMIRRKLNNIYGEEPDAKEEISEVDNLPEKILSKHQLYMKDLSDSGKSLEEIQIAWHQYYQSLNDAEKHEVWQEFYSEHARRKQAAPEEKVSTVASDNTSDEKNADTKPEVTSRREEKEKILADGATTSGPGARNRRKTGSGSRSTARRQSQRSATTSTVAPVSHNTAATRKRKPRARATKLPIDTETATDIKKHLISQVQSRSGIVQNPHVKSLIFGLSMGFLTLFFLLFGFFNERFITPFIRPNANVSATPIIVDPTATGPVGPESKIIIPKINVEAPVIYDVPTIEEKDIQKGLENGVVHYITTSNPGEKGNAVIFGHSSSNILNKGKYKFAFILLKSLNKDDTFIVQKDGKRYVYRVYNKFVTSPTDFSVLGPTDKVASLTLITCDPPGTSTNRLIIQAEQIFPNPANNAASSVQTSTEQPKQLPSNSESMWHRITNWL